MATYQEIHFAPFFTKRGSLVFNTSSQTGKTFVQLTAYTDESKREIKERIIFALEPQEIINLRKGLELLREEGFDRFKNFARWITPRSEKNQDPSKAFLGFVHRFEKDGEESISTFGLYTEKQENRLIIMFQGTKDNTYVAFPLDSTIYLKIEKILEILEDVSIENEIKQQMDIMKKYREKQGQNQNQDSQKKAYKKERENYDYEDYHYPGSNNTPF